MELLEIFALALNVMETKKLLCLGYLICRSVSSSIDLDPCGKKGPLK